MYVIWSRHKKTDYWRYANCKVPGFGSNTSVPKFLISFILFGVAKHTERRTTPGDPVDIFITLPPIKEQNL